MNSVLIIIPTYNERTNIEILLEQIFKLAIPNLKALVVDDNSPDGTGDLLENLKSRYPIEVMHRPKKMGLGTAYQSAFKKILAWKREKCPSFIVHMDADLSHDPKAIPIMLQKIKDCDLVLGSRYTKGGKINNWSLWRRLLSRFANFYARTVLRLPYRDLTSGYKCYRLETIKNLDLEHISSLGYNFLVETTYMAHNNGAKIIEVPITFVERKRGSSKLGLKIIIESFLKILKLAVKKR